MTTPRSARPSASQPDAADARVDAPLVPEATPARVPTATLDPALLARAAHDLRSPLTALVCNRRFLGEILAKTALDDPVLREILEDDAAALARLEQAVAKLDALARGKS